MEEDALKELRGVEKGLRKFLSSSTMVNLDGKLCGVGRDGDRGLSGAILRLDVILVVPKGATISHCLAIEF